MEEYGYVRSMSKKGCSPDNSACEGFFGTLKKRVLLPQRLDLHDRGRVYPRAEKVPNLVPRHEDQREARIQKLEGLYDGIRGNSSIKSPYALLLHLLCHLTEKNLAISRPNPDDSLVIMPFFFVFHTSFPNANKPA